MPTQAELNNVGPSYDFLVTYICADEAPSTIKMGFAPELYGPVGTALVVFAFCLTVWFRLLAKGF
jgi:hypothetical protein